MTTIIITASIMLILFTVIVFILNSKNQKVREFRKDTSTTLGKINEKMLLFWGWYGGADNKILKNLPSFTRLSRAGLAIAMFISAVIAGIIAFRTWGTIFHSSVAGAFIGILWYLAVWLLLDRNIIRLHDKEHANPNPRRFFNVKISTWMIVIRFAFVFCISYLNTKMVQFELFSKEIDAKIALTRKGNLDANIADRDGKLAKINEERDAAADNVSQALSAYNVWALDKESLLKARRDSLDRKRYLLTKEIEGLVGSGIKGYGPATKVKRQIISVDSAALVADMASFEAEKSTHPLFLALNDAKRKEAIITKRLDERMAKVNKDYEREKKRLSEAQIDGFVQKDVALGQVAKDSWFTVLMVFVMFFIFEAFPVILKMWFGTDSYTKALGIQTKQYEIENQNVTEVSLLNAQADHETNLNTAKERMLDAQITGTSNLTQKYATLHEIRMQRLNQFKQQIEDIKTHARETGADPDEAVKDILAEYPDIVSMV